MQQDNQMQVAVKPAAIRGTLTAPASKSAMQRACAAALLREGTTVIYNYGTSNDDKAALQIIQDLGAVVTYQDDNRLTVQSEGAAHLQCPTRRLHCQESGLSIRMFTPIAAMTTGEISISGSGSLAKRPMDFFDAILPQLGVSVSSNQGYLPLKVKGPLQPADLIIDGSSSSQYLTGLLFAYSAAGASAVSIQVHHLSSKPYIDLTLSVMAAFGMHLPEQRNYETFYFPERLTNNMPRQSSSERSLSFTVEADWSGGAFLLVAGAIAGSVTVKGLDPFSTQADKKILEALQDAGCRLSIQAEQVEVSRAPLRAFHFNAVDCPDLFPPLVVLAACCAGTSVIEGLHRLVHKESNRAETLKQEFAKLGVAISFQEDMMLVTGGSIKGAVVQSHHDHRIAMACAVAALVADGPVTITGASAVEKSYPGFYEDLRALCVADVQQ